MGQKVTATVVEIIEGTSKVSLTIDVGDNSPEVIYAIADKDSSVVYSEGEKITGKVIWIEYEKSLVHLSIKKKHVDIINDNQEIDYKILNTESPYSFKTLCTTHNVKVGYLKHQNGILVITPTRYHYNNLDALPMNKIFKVMPVKSVYGKMVVLEESIYEKMKTYQTVFPKKQKHPIERHVKQKKEHVMRNIQLRSKGPINEICLPEFKEGECERLLEWHDHYYLGSDDDDEDGDVDDNVNLPVNNEKKSETTQIETETVTKISKNKKKKNVGGKQEEKLKLKLKKPKIPQLDGTYDIEPLIDLFRKSHNSKTTPDFKIKSKNPKTTRPFQKNNRTNPSKNNGKFQKSIKKSENVIAFKKGNTKPDLKKAVVIDTELVENRSEEKPKKHLKLPGVENFWNNQDNKRTIESSSDDDEDEVVEVKRKKLTSVEKFQAIKDEENRVRQIEEELADPALDPHTTDQFDRLLLASPNSSLLWIKYMVFHMEAAELDKARAVAQRAIKTIHFREEGERLNVWIALLNLEIRYGTNETYRETLKEALRLNDAFKVYSRTLEILIDCKKLQEINDTIGPLMKKYKQYQEMWILVAKAYCGIGSFEKAKELLNRSLKSLKEVEREYYCL